MCWFKRKKKQEKQVEEIKEVKVEEKEAVITEDSSVKEEPVAVKKTAPKKSAPKTTKKEEPKKTTKKAEEEKTEEDAKAKKPVYRVIYDKEAKVWAIKKDGAKRTIATFKTKEEAMNRVKGLSASKELNFIVHKKDGKFQKK